MAELYKGIAGSPITYLVGDISAAQTTITIADDAALPDAPNICTLGYGEHIETIKYGVKSNGVLSDVTRGIEGTPRAWASGTEVARFFTAYDHNAIIEAHKTHQADYASKFPDNAGAHNSIFRGKNLGSTPDYTNITNGSFKDMYIGDYWTINGINWRIAAFNYYRNTGDTNAPSNHVVVVPDQSLYSHVMNDTNTTEGGYTGSKMYLEGLEQAKTIINNAFSGHVVTFRAYLSNAVSNGEASAGAWVDSTVDLMNEVMVYGSVVNGAATYGLYNIGAEKSQLPLFALNPQSINTRYSYWLRDVASASLFALVGGSGFAYRSNASYSFAVRPVFLIS